MTKPSHGKAPKRWSIGSAEWPGLSKVVEESGEVLQVIGKLMATGGDSAHWSGDMRTRLMEELADLQAALDFTIIENFSEDELKTIYSRVAEKTVRFRSWHEQHRSKK